MNFEMNVNYFKQNVERIKSATRRYNSSTTISMHNKHFKMQ